MPALTLTGSVTPQSSWINSTGDIFSSSEYDVTVTEAVRSPGAVTFSGTIEVLVNVVEFGIETIVGGTASDGWTPADGPPGCYDEVAPTFTVDPVTGPALGSFPDVSAGSLYEFTMVVPTSTCDLAWASMVLVRTVGLVSNLQPHMMWTLVESTDPVDDGDPWPVNGTVGVELAFGYGTHDDVPDEAWTDVTPYLDSEFSGTPVRCKRGRQPGPDAGIEVGTAKVRLENLDGRFDPRNADGPYFGDLVNGVPLRIRSGTVSDGPGYDDAEYDVDAYDADIETVWRGWVNSSWPQQFTERLPVVEITGHDLFGLLAKGDPPTSAWAVALADAAPEHWWRATEGGWSDIVGGLTARHTGRLQRVDPVLAGVDQSWGQPDPDGIGVIAHPAARLNPSTGAATVACRFRFASAAQRAEQGAEAAQVIWCQTGTATPEIDTPGYEPIFRAWVQANGSLAIDVATTSRYATYAVDPAYRQQLLDGRTHTIVVTCWDPDEEPWVWVDGRRFDLRLFGDFWLIDVTPRTITVGDLLIGGHTDTPYTGVIDELATWADHPGTETQLATLAAQLHQAAGEGWAGQRLDQRLEAIVDGAGAGNHIGDLDVSGVTARTPYEASRPLELLQTIEDTEQGRVWVDRDGLLRFSSRGWAWTDPESTTVQATFSDIGAEIDAGAIEFRPESVLNDSPFDLVNVATVASVSGRPQTSTDAASRDDNGARSVSLTGLLHGSDRQSLAIAQWLTYSQATPPVRLEEVSFAVESAPDVAGDVARRVREGWLVRLIKAPPIDAAGDDIGDRIDVSGHVVGVEHSWPFGLWIVTLWVDCTRAGRDWFRADSSDTDGTDVAAF